MSRKQFKEAADTFTIERRIQSCKTCPYVQKETCNRCGCFLVAKVGQKFERCPINRW